VSDRDITISILVRLQNAILALGAAHDEATKLDDEALVVDLHRALHEVREIFTRANHDIGLQLVGAGSVTVKES
jgi:hypothetical protein